MLHFHVEQLADSTQVQVVVHDVQPTDVGETRLRVASVVCGPTFEEVAAALAEAAGLRTTIAEGSTNG